MGDEKERGSSSLAVDRINPAAYNRPFTRVRKTMCFFIIETYFLREKKNDLDNKLKVFRKFLLQSFRHFLVTIRLVL